MAHELDAIDTQIIRILQEDGRASNVEIARRVGVSEATVRKRLDRLLSDGVVHITAMPDPARIGLSTVTFIAMDVDLSQLDRIANRLAGLNEVRTIYYTTGEIDLVLEAWFSSSDELFRFLTHRIASIPGIHRTAT